MYGILIDMTYFQIERILKNLRQILGDNRATDEILEYILELACGDIVNGIYYQEHPEILQNIRLTLLNSDTTTKLNAYISLISENVCKKSPGSLYKKDYMKMMYNISNKKIKKSIQQIKTTRIRKWFLSKERLWGSNWDFKTIYIMKIKISNFNDVYNIEIPALQPCGTLIYKKRFRCWPTESKKEEKRRYKNYKLEYILF